MRINLFLNKLSHDHSFLLEDGMAATGWIHGMPKPDMNPSLPIKKLMGEADGCEHLSHIGLRKEEWGAFLVHGPSASVYQLDHVATELFRRLKTGESLKDIRTNLGAISVSELDEFERLVKEFNLL
ncbi:hypothetical protein [Pseudomonas nitroreducens]|uniref:hypothetical protein n=1 Tax=Pseudomonas nitroreducens TaxID=46680 RepID=UPI00117ADC50|nr:hypothetical protein [Pseudomonas nitroreducens]NMZ57251.1 hypothetical protein [Pseudomonas nitroreducens]